MTAIKTKKNYEKPVMTVYLLKMQPQLLQQQSLPKSDEETEYQW